MQGDPGRGDDEFGGVDVVTSAPVSGCSGDQSREQALDDDPPGQLVVLGEFDELQERTVGAARSVSRRVERRPALCQGRLIGRSDQLVEVGQVGERVGEGTVSDERPP